MSQSSWVHFIHAIERQCETVVDSNWWTAWCTILTLFALFGDDVRVAEATKGEDKLFDVVTITALVTFALEVVIASIGKEEYFMSFFFVLDCVATTSLILDITSVAEDLFRMDDSADQQNVARASKTTLAGTKAGRVVRIIRLIRIVKLYKAAVEARARRERRKQLLANMELNKSGYKKDISPGDDPWEEDELKEEDPLQENEGQQSRVGKKLTEMTTRRVIVLVLSMLFVLPQLQYDVAAEMQGSPQFGADSLMVNYLEMVKKNAEGVTTKTFRHMYESSLLQYVYHHNWNARDCKEDKCPPGPWDYLSHLLWLGFTGETLPSTVLVKEYNDPSRWDDWFAYGSDDSPIKSNFTSGSLPTAVKQKFLEPWTDPCGSWKGIRISSEGQACDDLRWTEFEVTRPFFIDASSVAGKRESFVFAFDIRKSTTMEARLNMGQTCFICAVLTLGAMLISRDTNRLVLVPIEHMIEKVHRIRDNPLIAMKLGDEEFKKAESDMRSAKALSMTIDKDTVINEAFQKYGRKWYWMFYVRWLSWKARKRKKTDEPIEEPMETLILEKTIIKLGSLLALGFGEAGANIIGQNMRGAGAGVNAMIPGKRVEGIFGFCDIRNFTDCTEILQDKVMVFVNQIGEIVHSIVDMYHGVANKNIGDAFLLVWRVRALDEDLDHFRRTRMCDMSVISFVKIIAAINQSVILSEYRGHPGLLARLPRYRVRMGFGLHLGAAIEGAIGSEFKIDASYLSPNVNMASRLEAATKQFGCSILISGILMDKCSEKLAQECRVVDHVSVKGSKQPVKVFTVDLDYLSLELEETRTSVGKLTRKLKYEVRQVRDMEKTKKWAEGYSAYNDFINDAAIQKMRTIYIEDFFQRFSMGFRNYEAGQWQVARDVLEHTRYMLRLPDGFIIEDLPSATLLLYMKDFNYEAPDAWRGFRSLTEK